MMVKHYVMYRCKNSPAEGITLRECPKEVNRCKKWVRCVQRTRKWESKPNTSHICRKHFSREAISTYFQVEMGVAKRLTLIEVAIPTIYPSTESDSTAMCNRRVNSDKVTSTSQSSSRNAFRKRSCQGMFPYVLAFHQIWN